GPGSKPDKVRGVIPDLPIDQEFIVSVQNGKQVTVRGVTDFKNKQRIFNDLDKHNRRQLEEMFNYATEKQVPMNLVIGRKTRYITSEVADFVRKTDGVVLEFRPKAKHQEFLQVEIGNIRGQAWKRPGS
ncbi:MAG: hypothetical protein MN733_19000, partial [Nitrososphaera sp.]|nr:hypothetical protein [Nitrososphaera sp.]